MEMAYGRAVSVDSVGLEGMSWKPEVAYIHAAGAAVTDVQKGEALCTGRRQGDG